MKQFFIHTKEFIGLAWTFCIMGIIWYVIIHFGDSKEVLFSILGFITGVATTVTGAYFTISDRQRAATEQIEAKDSIDTVKITADTAEVKATNVNDGTEK